MTTDSQHNDTSGGSPVTFINVFEIDGVDLDEFVSGWEKRVDLMRAKPGFVDSRLHRARSTDTRFQLVNISHWSSEELYEAAIADTQFSTRTRAALDEAGQAVTPNPGLYDVVAEVIAP
ncbi:antibiotic biosynthesis monooxygenase family protein [Streptomyces formicae]